MNKLKRKMIWGGMVAATVSGFFQAAEVDAATLTVVSNNVTVTGRRDYTPLTFAAFDESLGSLTSIFVQYHLTYSAMSSVTYSQTGGFVGQTYSVSYSVNGTLGEASGDIFLNSSASKFKSGESCGDTCLVFGSTQAPPPVTLTVSGAGTISKSQLITDPNVLSDFVGADPLSIDNITGADAHNGYATASTYLTVRYVYDQAAAPAESAVPEPASWTLMLVGFGAIGAAMRRRKVTPRVSYAA